MSNPNGRPPRVAAVILAAGRSQRFGDNKLLAELDGRPLLQHVIDAACASKVAAVVVVLGSQAGRVRAALRLTPEQRAASAASRSHDPDRRPPLRIVVNEAFAQGQGSSLRAGLAAVPEDCEAAAVLLGDEPLVDASLIDAMCEVFSTVDPSQTSVVRPLFAGGDGHGVPGHPVILARSVWSCVADQAGDQTGGQGSGQAGDRGARAWIEAHPERVLLVPVDAEAPIDVDCPADLERLLARRTRRHD